MVADFVVTRRRSRTVGDADGRHGIQHQKTTKIQTNFVKSQSRGIGFVFFFENKDTYKSQISHLRHLNCSIKNTNFIMKLT